MAPEIINIYEAKAQLSRLIARAQDGEDVVIARAGKPVARLVKWEPQRERIPGAWKGQVHMSDGFDEFTAQDERDWYGET